MNYAAGLGIGLLLPVSAQAVELFDGKVDVKFYLAQGWQSAVETDSVSPAFPVATDAESGFRRLRANIVFTAQITDRLSAYLELAEEPNDWSTAEVGQISQDLAFIDYKLTDSLLFRFGNVVTTLQNYIPYSDGAVVQGNPLIGNSPIDFITAEQGIQLVGTHPISDGFVNNIGWDFTITNPNFLQAGNFFEDMPYQFFGKVRFAMDHGLNFGGGIFYVDGSDQFISAGGSAVPAPGAGKTSAMFFGDGENYSLPGQSPNSRSMHVALIPGIDVFYWQLDAKWDVPTIPLTLRAWGGIAEDNWRYVNAGGAQTTFGLSPATVIEQDSEMPYYGVEGKFNLSDKFYVAARYSWAENDSPGATGDTDLDRIQVGGGYWINDSMLFKLEYISQSEGIGGPGQIGADWDGFGAEASIAF